MLPLSASIVLYRSDPAELEQLCRSLSASDLTEWIVVDNSASEDPSVASRLKQLVISNGGRYVPSLRNVGFGAGHNLALASQTRAAPEYHLMLNPDIVLEPAALELLVKEMQQRPNIGLIMPRVSYADGAFQPVCKLLPTALDFALRRFAPEAVKRLFATRLHRYELNGIEHRECDRVPFLSGCFLFARRSVLDRIDGFDERFFLYLEDVDFCRRMARHAKLLYWPRVSVTHICFRGAYRSRKLMWLFLRSSFAYFQKWGWFFDGERKKANEDALLCLRAARTGTERR